MMAPRHKKLECHSLFAQKFCHNRLKGVIALLTFEQDSDFEDFVVENVLYKMCDNEYKMLSSSDLEMNQD